MGLETTPTRASDLNSAWPVGATDKRDGGDDHLRNIKAVLKATLQRMPGAEAINALTIASGSVTPIAGICSIETEAAAETDDLDTIVVTNVPDNGFLLVRNVNAARSVVLKHGTGNLTLPGNTDITMSSAVDFVLLRRSGANFVMVVWLNTTLILEEIAAVPATPSTGKVTTFAVAAGLGSGVHQVDDAGAVAQIDGGAEVLADEAAVLTNISPETLVMTPTEDRILTLPTTGVRVGRRFTLSNLSASFNVIIKSSAGNIVETLSKATITLVALQDTPTSSVHWGRTYIGRVMLTLTAASGTWTPPVALTNAFVIIAGGGGGGGGTGGGGGSGGEVMATFIPVSGGQAYVLGAGGAGGAAGVAGSNGIGSSFGPLSVLGGFGGAAGPAGAGGLPYTDAVATHMLWAAGGDAPGVSGMRTPYADGGAGGSGNAGGGGGAAYAAGGKAGTAASEAEDGTQGSGGGGGSDTSPYRTGHAGGRGTVIIFY